MITFFLIAINLAVFICMAISGVPLTDPPSLFIIKWGGMHGDSILSGEWWRIGSSMFVHCGVIHLLLNMYTLYFIGIRLEPLLGKARFLTAYTAAGILSALFSFIFHVQTDVTMTAAGASGAIFGMFGLFVALLSTTLLPGTVRGALLKNALSFIAFNFVYGLSSQTSIDNAAHFGGLLSGLMLGYALYPSISFLRRKKTIALIKEGKEIETRHKRLNLITLSSISMATLLIAASVFSAYKQSDIQRFVYLRDQFFFTESLYTSHLNGIDQKLPIEIFLKLEHDVLPEIKKATIIASKLEPLRLYGLNAKMRDYLSAHISLIEQMFQLVAKGAKENSPAYDIHIQLIEAKIKKLSNEFTGQFSKSAAKKSD